MSLTTDDGFIIETQDMRRAGDGDKITRWIVLALDETEALGLLKAEMPDLDHRIVASGDDIRAQAARLGIEPGTYRQT